MVYQAVTDDLISIGPPYFNTIFVPLMMLLFVFVGIGPLSRWKQTSWTYLAAQLGKVLFASLLVGLIFPLIVLSKFLCSGDHNTDSRQLDCLCHWQRHQ